MKTFARWLVFAAIGVCLPACNRTPPADDGKIKSEKPIVQVQPRPQPPSGDPAPMPTPPEQGKTLPLLPPLPELPDPMADLAFAPKDAETRQYEAALAEALEHMADQKWTEALEAYEEALAIRDSEFVKNEIAKLKSRIEQDTAARRTVQEIATILEEGKGKDAAELARKALKEFGDGDVSEQILKLRLQAEALEAAASKETGDVRFASLKQEGEAALAEQNLRAAVLAFNQALQIKEDADLRAAASKARDSLQRYDALRQRAAELRRDPQRYEEALAALQDARDSWDTLQVRQEIDECLALLNNRRDSLAVVDFDTHGVVGFGDAGRALAAELLPHFKTRFNLVEQAQIAKVLRELKIDDGIVEDPAEQREVGKAARVRYLVLGSVHRLGEAFVQARIVDTRSGLVVQTAKIAAPTIPELLPRIPELAAQLLMSDEEKLAWLDKQAKLAPKIEPPRDDAPLPAIPLEQPVPMIGEAPPAPPVEILPVAPEFGKFDVRIFKPIEVAVPQAGIVVVPGEAPQNFRYRLLYGGLYWGDHFYRAGHYRAALRYYEFALTLAPGDFAIRLRIEQTLRHVPPVVVVASTPVPMMRPRVALLDFFETDPRLPAGLGAWTPRAMAPYFAPHYDVVDPGEVYWFMGKMGLTLSDIVGDPIARRWLGRALGIQYFVFGYITPGSFRVTTYMVHAEQGYMHSQGHLHVRDLWELKVRLFDLARMTMSREQHNLYVAHRPQFEVLLTKGRDAMGRRDFRIAIGFFDDALRLIPGNIEALAFRQQCLSHQEHVALEELRRRDYLARKAAEEEARRRQWALAEQAHRQRIHVGVQIAALGDPARRRIEEDRLIAQNNLVTQAQLALKAKNFTLAIGFFESALKLAPAQPAVVVNPAVPVLAKEALVQQLADARAQAAAAEQAAAQAQLQAKREAELRQKREQELARAQQKILDDRKKAQEVAALKQAALDKDFLAAKQQADVYMNEKKYDAAIASLHAAQRIKQDALVAGMLQRAMELRAEQTAKNEKEKQEIEAQLKAERERRLRAEAEAKQNQDKYKLALELANKALAARDLTVAETKFEEAGRLFKSDAVLTGLARVRAARQEQTKLEEKESQGKKRLKSLLDDAKASLAAENPAAALKALHEARKLSPQNVEVQSHLAQAEQMRDRIEARARQKEDEAERTKNFDRFIAAGRDNLKNKQFDAAAVAFKEALKLRPGDSAATGYLKDAEDGRSKLASDAAAQAAGKKRADDYQKLLGDGQLALKANRLDDAIKIFGDAQKLMPGDKTSQTLLADAQQAKNAQLAAVENQRKLRKQHTDLLDAGKKALAAGKHAEAIQLFAQAKNVLPMDKTSADLLRLAEKAQYDAKVASEKAQFAKAKLAQDYQAAMTAAANALKSQQFADAQKHFQAALALVPKDAAASQGLAQAKAGLQTQAISQQAYQNEMAAGQLALNAKNYDLAEKHFRAALKLRPSDPAAVQAIDASAKARDNAKLLEIQQNQAKFNQALLAAQSALAQKKYAEAQKAFQAALQLKPGDPSATQGLAQAKQAIDSQQQSANLKKSYGDFMNKGAAAAQAKNFAEAMRLYQEAKKLFPNDPSVDLALAQTAQQWEAAKKAVTPPPPPPPKKTDPPKKVTPPPPPPVNPNAKYDQEMATAQAAEKGNRWDDALRAYGAALKAKPGDPQAAAGLNRSQYGWYLNQGIAALNARNYPAAIGAFEGALRVVPNDPRAKALLDQAKKAKK
jgi:tetratricopeptide (TPR) repeat protein